MILTDNETDAAARRLCETSENGPWDRKDEAARTGYRQVVRNLADLLPEPEPAARDQALFVFPDLDGRPAMNFDLVRPCGDCPFRSDKPGYIKPERVREILGGGKGRQHWPACSFPCHKTIDYVGDDRAVIPPSAQQCAGVMIILTREGRPNDAMQIAQRLGLWDPSRLDMDAPVHKSVREAMEGTAW